MVVVERLETIFKSIMQNSFFDSCLLNDSLLKAHNIHSRVVANKKARGIFRSRGHDHFDGALRDI